MAYDSVDSKFSHRPAALLFKVDILCAEEEGINFFRKTGAYAWNYKTPNLTT
jgi:hypothetical protein